LIDRWFWNAKWSLSSQWILSSQPILSYMTLRFLPIRHYLTATESVTNVYNVITSRHRFEN